MSSNGKVKSVQCIVLSYLDWYASQLDEVDPLLSQKVILLSLFLLNLLCTYLHDDDPFCCFASIVECTQDEDDTCHGQSEWTVSSGSIACDGQDSDWVSPAQVHLHKCSGCWMGGQLSSGSMNDRVSGSLQWMVVCWMNGAPVNWI